MNRIFKFLEMAGAAIIVLSLLGIGFYIMNQGKEVIEQVSAEGFKDILDYREHELTIYDGKTVSGYEVISFIEDISESDREIAVRVYTGEGGSTPFDYVRGLEIAGGASTEGLVVTGITEKNYEKKYDVSLGKTDSGYINPNGSFEGKVFRNKDDVIIAVVFVQK